MDWNGTPPPPDLGATGARSDTDACGLELVAVNVTE